jgi:hypothetical protein
MKRLKQTLLLLTFFFTNNSFSQTQDIVKILNRELEIQVAKEPLKIMNTDSSGVEYVSHIIVDTMQIVKPFVLKDNVLSFTVERTLKSHNPQYYGRIIITQEVALDKITGISQDIGIFLDTEPESVTFSATLYHEDGKVESYEIKQGYMRTYLFSPTSKNLPEDLIKAFKKAGITIQKGVWYN